MGVANSPDIAGKDVNRIDYSKRTSRSCLAAFRPWSRRVGGFTLIELLVVMATIALLLGLLIPCLGLAREKVYELICRSHLEAVAKAVQMYANDNGGRFPEVTDPNQTPQQIREKLRPYVSSEKIFYCPVSKLPYDFCVTSKPKTTLSNVRIDLLSQPHRVLIGGESSFGTHEDDMLYVITADFEVVQISMQKWFELITTDRS
ncbi:MAG: prepilin-type N-terminal cleavage/methylation domain-containing protein [Phycisphaerales bacterium]|nr:MAG: prepilin-type N-terminal cleavage/methylation domain-containing protein [Phycisphaerales bacterium]